MKYSWRRFDIDTNKLAQRIIRSGYKPKTIVAMARGGLCLGVKLSHILKRPLLIISAKAYSEKGVVQNTVVLNSSYTVPLQSPVLIVDEIADTGTTLKVVLDHFKGMNMEIKTLTLLFKTRSKVKPDYYIKKIKDDVWAEFPWEA